MKSSTMHILVGIGFAATAVASAASTALACRAIRRKEEEYCRELTIGEKIKTGLPYYIPLATLLGFSEFGLYKCYETSQEAIKLGSEVVTATGNVLNGYRAVIRDDVGKKREAELYNKSLEQTVLPKIPERTLTDIDQVIVSIMPYEGSVNSMPECTFVSTPDQIRDGLSAFNKMYAKRSIGNSGEAYATLEELLYYFGQTTNNKALRDLTWIWSKDGPVEFEEPFDYVVRNGQKVLLLSFVVNPHYI